MIDKSRLDTVRHVARFFDRLSYDEQTEEIYALDKQLVAAGDVKRIVEITYWPEWEIRRDEHDRGS